MKVTELTFSAAEIEEISGILRVNQRDHRRRGRFAKVSGKAKFDIFDAVDFLFIQKMSDSGLGPSRAMEFVDSARDHLLIAVAVMIADEIELSNFPSETISALREAFPDQSDEGLKAPLAHIYLKASEPHRLNQHPYRTARTAQSTQDDFEKALLQPGGIFVVWADGSAQFCEDFIGEKEKLEETDPKLNGAIIIIDLRSLGAGLIDKLRPFLSPSSNGAVPVSGVAS